MRYLIPVVLIAGLIVLFARGLELDPQKVPSPFIGQPVPAFDLPQLADATQRINEASLQGEISLFNVWATWCGGCRAEHDVLLDLARAGIPIIGLNWKDDRDKAQQWLKQLGDPYRAVAFDDVGQTAINWGVYGAPETFLIDRQGIIRHKFIGPLTRDIVKNELVPLLRELNGLRALESASAAQ